GMLHGARAGSAEDGAAVELGTAAVVGGAAAEDLRSECLRLGIPRRALHIPSSCVVQAALIPAVAGEPAQLLHTGSRNTHFSILSPASDMPQPAQARVRLA